MFFFDMTVSSYTCSIYLYYVCKYQMASVKALVQVDFHVHALSEH